MIIDRIIDRIDNATTETPYKPKDFYIEMLCYGGYWGDEIARAMDYGTEEYTKRTLCNYIDHNEYNPLIKDYINAVTWLETTPTDTDTTAAHRFFEQMNNR